MEKSPPKKIELKHSGSEGSAKKGFWEKVAVKEMGMNDLQKKGAGEQTKGGWGAVGGIRSWDLSAGRGAVPC